MTPFKYIKPFPMYQSSGTPSDSCIQLNSTDGDNGIAEACRIWWCLQGSYLTANYTIHADLYGDGVYTADSALTAQTVAPAYGCVMLGEPKNRVSLGLYANPQIQLSVFDGYDPDGSRDLVRFELWLWFGDDGKWYLDPNFKLMRSAVVNLRGVDYTIYGTLRSLYSSIPAVGTFDLFGYTIPYLFEWYAAGPQISLLTSTVSSTTTFFT